MDLPLFYDIGIIIIIASIIGFLVQLLKQPLIPYYILTGLIIGPFGLNLLSSRNDMMALSEIGIVFLLFIVGLEININKLKEVSLVASLGGFLQVFLVFLFSFFVALLFGFSILTSVYLGLILAFSSTLIVVKYLSDKDELDNIDGRISIGILLIQDLLAIIAISLLANFNSSFFSILLLKGIFLVALAIFLGYYFMPKIFNFASKSYELTFLGAITTCFIFAFLANYLGFSYVIGAFLAGLVLAPLPYSLNLAGRIKPLRDFFVTIFFVILGTQLFFANFRSIILPFFVFLVIIMLVKPIIIMLLVSFFGYKKRVSFLSGVNLAQTSEFSLILVAQGLLLGNIPGEILTLTVLLIIASMGLSVYLIKYNFSLYLFFSPILDILDKIHLRKLKIKRLKKQKDQIVLFGGHRAGRVIIETMKSLREKILVIDYNPEVINILKNKSIPCIYGDLTNEEVLNKINLKGAKLIISTVPKLYDNLFLLNYVKSLNKKIPVFTTTAHMHEAKELYNKGADYVILPNLIAGEKIVDILTIFRKNSSILEDIKKRQMKQLTTSKLLDYQLTIK